ncbi:DUF3459 domain-containing protein, partial [candidate division KSB1 bacterium]|nr:DUF3459 domain-containing protein [candidate division KSB1 bacterium]
YIPLIFMGEEYGESSPFLYFVSHGDPNLIKAVREGRKSEFKSFRWKGEPPDPQSVDTFFQSKIDWDSRNRGKHKVLWHYYKELISLRKNLSISSTSDKHKIRVCEQPVDKVFVMHRWDGSDEVIVIFNFNKELVNFKLNIPSGKWTKMLDSADQEWQSSGTELSKTLTAGNKYSIKPLSMAVYRDVKRDSSS